MVTEALITELVVADGIEPIHISQDNVDDPVELQLRFSEDDPETVDLYLRGKLVFRADWESNLYQFFKKAVERWGPK